MTSSRRKPLPFKTSLIAAVAENGVIGDGAGLPWDIPGEVRYFSRMTRHKPYIMGRRTFETMKGPLKDRANIVVTRDAAYSRPGIIAATSLEKALWIAAAIAAETGAEEIMIGGGADIFRLALPIATRLYLTEVHMRAKGDILFPPFDRNEWVETKREFHKAATGESADYTVTVLDRRA
jgi:dihydrofolate reductase